MNNIISDEVISEEDVYADTPELGDAANELLKIFVHEDGTLELITEELLIPIEERYERRKGYPGTDRILELIASHPEKVLRINKVVEMINQNVSGEKDKLLHKQLCNEFVRLTQGKNVRVYTEPETDPDLLVL
jgi:hypothetical protein